MLIITRESVRDLKARLEKGENLEQCKAEIAQMIDIKKTLLWRSELSCNCVGTALPMYLSWEVQALEEALAALEQGKVAQAVSLLGNFISRLEQDRTYEPLGA